MNQEISTILKEAREKDALDRAYSLGFEHGSCGMCDKNPYSLINEPELYQEYSSGFEDGADRLEGE